MSLQRSISWSSALRDLKDDRVRRPAGALITASAVTFFSHSRRLVVAGQYDRSAIMAVAVQAAKTHQRTYGSTWAQAMSLALSATWRAARAARAATVN